MSSCLDLEGISQARSQSGTVAQGNSTIFYISSITFLLPLLKYFHNYFFASHFILKHQVLPHHILWFCELSIVIL